MANQETDKAELKFSQQTPFICKQGVSNAHRITAFCLRTIIVFLGQHGCHGKAEVHVVMGYLAGRGSIGVFLTRDSGQPEGGS